MVSVFSGPDLGPSRAPENPEGVGLDFASVARQRRRHDSRVVRPDPPLLFLGEARLGLLTRQILEAAGKFRGGEGGTTRHAGDDYFYR